MSEIAENLKEIIDAADRLFTNLSTDLADAYRIIQIFKKPRDEKGDSDGEEGQPPNEE